MPPLQIDPMISTHCAICGPNIPAVELYPQNLDSKDITPQTYSARRKPDKVHFRMVKCNFCGLVRSDPVINTNRLQQLYQHSKLTYSQEIPHLTNTYLSAIKLASQYIPTTSKRILEIGCGNGFLLDAVLHLGYDAWGVEPSRHAVSLASPQIKSRIKLSHLKLGLFPAQSFDLICMFQVLDHLPDPKTVLAVIHQLLKPGGIILCFNHNVDSWTAKILKEQSPIIDIEHTYLYSPKTITQLFETNGFQTIRVQSAWNQLSLYHLLHLLPGWYSFVNKTITKLNLQRVSLTLPLGNLVFIARKLEQTTDLMLESNITAFNQDVKHNQGYRYTTHASISSQLANQRLTQATISAISLSHKSIIDIGCGDGTYTYQLASNTKARQVIGIDPADHAITSAKKRFKHQNLTFKTGNAYRLPYPDKNFDLAILRGVLHHLDNPQAAVLEAVRVATAVVIIEPNGFNPILKLIEKFSPYHRAHEEKSYPASKINQWISQANASVRTRSWLGLVPFFCPDLLAKTLKKIEPLIEKTPYLNRLLCAVYVAVLENSPRKHYP